MNIDTERLKERMIVLINERDKLYVIPFINLYIYKRETTAHGSVDKCRFDAVAEWLSSEEMGYKVTKEMYEYTSYPNPSYDYRLKVEW